MKRFKNKILQFLDRQLKIIQQKDIMLNFLKFCLYVSSKLKILAPNVVFLRKKWD